MALCYFLLCGLNIERFLSFCFCFLCYCRGHYWHRHKRPDFLSFSSLLYFSPSVLFAYLFLGFHLYFLTFLLRIFLCLRFYLWVQDFVLPFYSFGEVFWLFYICYPALQLVFYPFLGFIPPFLLDLLEICLSLKLCH